MKLVLASSSPYRRELLQRLRLEFEVCAPDVDETPATNEIPERTASRLAQEKARAVSARFSDSLIIGSDQIATLDGKLLAKPGTRENASKQLRLLRGRKASFQTAVALHNSFTGKTQMALVPTLVVFRHLSDEQIESYLSKEPAYDCVGSGKIEGLGIALVEKIETEDPTALIGLPLIALTGMLLDEGVTVL
ncbi:MAG: Maf family nucleotide pyrophosphatase [Burkholderiales bacterium]